MRAGVDCEDRRSRWSGDGARRHAAADRAGIGAVERVVEQPVAGEPPGLASVTCVPAATVPP